MSEIVKWLWVMYITAQVSAVIAAVGKPREPITGEVAAVVAFFGTLEIIAILMFWESTS